MSRRIANSSLFAVSVLFLAAPAFAQELTAPADFPERPLTWVVSTGPGGGVDQMSRALAKEMQDIIGVGIQVVNRPGSNGLVAIAEVDASPADGYTYYLATDAYVTAYAAGLTDLQPGVDMVPLCITQVTFTQMYSRPGDDRFGSLASLVETARSSGQPLTVANISHAGGAERILATQIEKVLGIQFDQISYDNPGERYSSLLGGHVDLLIEQPGDVGQFIKSGAMQPVITILPEAPGAFPKVPALSELAKLNSAASKIDPLLRFRALWVSAKVPEDRRAYMAKACERAFNTEAYQAFNETKFMNVVSSFKDTDEAAALVKQMVTTYQGIYKELNLVQK